VVNVRSRRPYPLAPHLVANVIDTFGTRHHPPGVIAVPIRRPETLGEARNWDYRFT
jgi:hypothetical protein